MNDWVTNESDFRNEATQISLAAIAARGVSPERGDLSTVGISLCVPAPGDAARFRKSMGRRMLLLTILGVGGVAFGGIAAFAEKHGMTGAHGDQISPLLAVGLAASVGGIALMVSAVAVQRRAILRHLQSNSASRPAFAGPEKPIVVSVENPETFERIKLVTEDVAALYPDASRRLIVMEGFSHRYVIRGDDVVFAYPRSAQSSHGVVIAFRVAGSDRMLSLILVYNSAGMELKRQTIGMSRPKLADILE